MKRLIICIFTLFAVTNTQFPPLPPSFSFKGDGDFFVFFAPRPSYPIARYNVANDVTRGLQFVDISILLPGSPINVYGIYSVNDNATYIDQDGVCSANTFSDLVPFLADSNTWDLFATANENPAGQFTTPSYNASVIIEDGLPVLFVDGGGSEGVSEDNSINSLACFCLFAVLAATNAQLPELSASFSLEGTAVYTIAGTVITVPRYNVANDVTRGLQLLDNGVCSDESFSKLIPFQADSNTWDLFNGSTEEPAGTFSVSTATASYELIILDGVPAVFTVINTDSDTALIIIHSFRNEVPAFSRFILPDACSDRICASCYDPSVTTITTTTMGPTSPSTTTITTTTMGPTSPSTTTSTTSMTTTSTATTTTTSTATTTTTMSTTTMIPTTEDSALNSADTIASSLLLMLTTLTMLLLFY
ncbi:hypothetical protein LOD99_8364 [Oopsacas minuta]|uniref:Uncharacterized protein n=1 Tax=Oopsacas minuta TaxID=111878 RepID=A0AAV7JGV8_9METZ|nr:hypothetical protein LOD99_8364 [Oopsacas minuta]